jgi:hypothetical protein
VNASIPKQLLETMAIRARRMHYCLWHEVRDNWLTYPRDLQSELRKAGWEPSRPANDEKGEPLLTNDSGEDYLYMHRQTTRYANKILAKAGDPTYPRIEGWLNIPSPDDADFLVPAPWFDPAEFPAINQFIARSKTDLTFEKYLKPWESMFTDPGFLKDINLGTLGSLIHSTVHTTVKRRWSTVPGARRPEPGPEFEAIPIEWDDPRYDYLADFYSMQVNPVFWKLSGWIDERIENWKLVHGVFGNDFWKGKWMGKIPKVENGASAELHDRLDDPAVASKHAEEIEQILLTIGKRLASS